MKSPTILLLASGFATLTVTAAPPVMRDAATHTQLGLLFRQASQADPMRKQAPATGPDPSTATPPGDLIADSDIVCFNGNVTLLPKRAILQIPKKFPDRFKYQLGSKLLSWGDFYALNRSWITTLEVSRSQAAGNLPMTDKSREQMVKSGNLVVATYHAGPISVLPLKVPEEPAPDAPLKTGPEKAPSTTPTSPLPAQP